MRLQTRLNRAEDRLKEQSSIYFWARFEELPLGPDQDGVLGFLRVWIQDDNAATIRAYPLEEWPNLYLWLGAVYHFRADLAPERPITQPLPSEEIDLRLSLLPPLMLK